MGSFAPKWLFGRRRRGLERVAGGSRSPMLCPHEVCALLPKMQSLMKTECYEAAN
jgi:hypothetical protein